MTHIISVHNDDDNKNSIPNSSSFLAEENPGFQLTLTNRRQKTC